MRCGWYWGGQEFRERLEKLIPKIKNRNYRSSTMVKDAGITDAKQILRRAEQHFGLGEGELRRLPRGDLRRAAIGWAIRSQRCVPLIWVAEELNLSSAANASQQIRRFSERKPSSLTKDVRAWKK